MSDAERPARTPVVLSTSSVYPERTPDAFETAVRLGYDGLEVMVYTDPVSQDVDVIRRLMDYHQLPVLAVHAPSLLLTQRVWGREPWEKIRKSQVLAEQLGAKIVVVHPPFRWQRDYAVDFETGLAAMEAETDIVFAVENMFPLRARGREIVPYAPSWDPTTIKCANVTLDLSHASASGSDIMAMAEAVGDRLAHVHLADGTGSPVGPFPDEHLVPGRGSQPCAEFLQRLAATGYPGMVVLEVNTRRAVNRDERLADLAESLAFAREHLSQVPAH
ncbi:MAG TPA: sugar phosphate isomerase/epimerase [Streptosporangiaceae bacterium]|nr:sugar phosphate isomerase/epimerase [Streptosporangiaceae bacterium]